MVRVLAEISYGITMHLLLDFGLKSQGKVRLMLSSEMKFLLGFVAMDFQTIAKAFTSGIVVMSTPAICSGANPLICLSFAS